jgi:4'-phosphopantetheinyl transferase
VYLNSHNFGDAGGIFDRVQTMNSRYLKRLQNPLSPEIHLWWVDLDAYGKALALDSRDGSNDVCSDRKERVRMSRRSLASKHALRRVVADALGRSPECIEIHPGRFGKPQLSDNAVHFNLSHSGPYALIGVHRELAIGVDLEVVRTTPDSAAIVRENFTEDERGAWLGEGVAKRDRVFLSCWTRKEAAVKALGTGFLVAPSRIDVGCSSDTRQVVIVLGTKQCKVVVASLPGMQNIVASVAMATRTAVVTAQDFAASVRRPLDSVS